MPKPTHSKARLSKRNLYLLVLVLIVLILGFSGGILYADHRNSNAAVNQLVPSGNIPPTICNCPMLPVRATASDYCRC